MEEDEFRKGIEKELDVINIKLSDKQIHKLYCYMRTFIGMEPEN